MKLSHIASAFSVIVFAGCTGSGHSKSAPVKADDPVVDRPAQSPTPLADRFKGMDISITAHGDSDAGNAIDAAKSAFKKVERLASAGSPDYELADLSKAVDGIQVSPETFRVIERAIYWMQRTGGAYSCVKGGKAEDIELMRSTRTVRMNPGKELDISGLVTGSGVDAAVKELKAARVRSAEISAGPVQLLIGKGKEGLLEIPIEHPRRKGKVLGALGVLDAAVVRLTDIGDYRGPAKDPRTGDALTGTLSVHALSRNAVDAQALALALFVLGPTDGRTLIERMPSSEALLFSVDSEDPKQLHTMITRGMQSHMKWKVKPRGR